LAAVGTFSLASILCADTRELYIMPSRFVS
jgi:hypothetical protein